MKSLPPELSPIVAQIARREAENRRRLLQLLWELDQRNQEVDRLRNAVKETDLRRVAEVGAIRHDLAEEHQKNAQLREKLVKAENDKRAAAREMLDAKLAISTLEAERKKLELELVRLRSIGQSG